MLFGKPFGKEDFYAMLLPFKSRLWLILHVTAKQVMRKQIDFLYARCFKEIYAKKMKDGWINPEIALFHWELEQLFEKEYMNDKTKRDADGTWNLKHKDMRMFYELRAIMCTMLDEDTFYLLRFLYCIEMVHRDYPEYNERMHKARAYWDWGKIMEKLKENDMEWIKAYAANNNKEVNDNVRRIQDEDRSIPSGN